MPHSLRTKSRSAMFSGTLFLFCMAGQNFGVGTPSPSDLAWKQIPGALREIAVGGRTLWGIGTSPADSNGNFTIQRWTGSAWETVPGQALKIAVEPNGVPWVISAQGNIFRRNTSVAGGWEQKPGAGTDIAIGSNGAVFVVGGTQRGVNNGLYSWNGSSWVVQPGQGVRVAVEGTGAAWLMNAAGVPWRQDTAATRGWRQMPGTIGDIAAGANTVWSITAGAAAGQVQRWNGGSWTAANCTAAKIAVTVDGFPWVVTATGDVFQAILGRIQTPHPDR